MNLLNNFLNLDFLENQYVKAILSILILMYASSIGPNLSPFVKNLFSNSFFKIFILFIIVNRAERDPLFSLSLSILYVLIINALSQQKATEAFTNIDKLTKMR
jgi:hypothetical protein